MKSRKIASWGMENDSPYYRVSKCRTDTHVNCEVVKVALD